jgi:hypothetical protein
VGFVGFRLIDPTNCRGFVGLRRSRGRGVRENVVLDQNVMFFAKTGMELAGTRAWFNAASRRGSNAVPTMLFQLQDSFLDKE